MKQYSISSSDVATRYPKDWNLLGSQDGSTWTTLDSQSNQLFANRGQQNTYHLGNTTAYRYYRLEITANNGAGGVALCELGLWGDTGRTIPDGTYCLVSRKSNKVIDLVAGDTADGTDALQGGWNGGDSQKWTVTPAGDGAYKLLNVNSGKAADVNSGSTADGAAIIQWPYSGADNQQWRFSIAP